MNDWVTDGDGGCVPPPQIEAPKCGPGFTYRDGYCDDNYAGDHNGGIFSYDPHGPQILKCTIIGEPYDPNTGLCQTPTPRRPRNCTPGFSKDGKSFTTCDIDTKGVISESIRFCSVGTFTSDGICQIKPLTPAAQAVSATTTTPACNPRIMAEPMCNLVFVVLGNLAKFSKKTVKSSSVVRRHQVAREFPKWGNM